MNLQLITEKELVKGCLKQEDLYKSELFRRFSGKMLGICRRYSRSRDDAYDIFQDSFIKVYDHLSEYNFQGSLEGWIIKIVIRTALNFYRKYYFQNEKPGLEHYQNSFEISPDVLTDLNEQDIITAISDLPDGYRMVFNLYAIEGYSHKEIAEMLHIDESTSRTQLFKARNVLKSLLYKTQNILI